MNSTFDLGKFVASTAEHAAHCFRAGMDAMNEKIIRHLWSDTAPEDRPADLVADLLERHDYWQKRAEEAERKLKEGE